MSHPQGPKGARAICSMPQNTCWRGVLFSRLLEATIANDRRVGPGYARSATISSGSRSGSWKFVRVHGWQKNCRFGRRWFVLNDLFLQLGGVVLSTQFHVWSRQVSMKRMGCS